MKWTIKIGTLFGIGLYLHLTFILLLSVLGTVTWLSTGQFWAALTGVLFVVAVFACVLLHELGHALMAWHFGIRTRDITLLPIGGIARMDRIPEKPAQELWIILAGPATNLILASVIILGLLAKNSFGTGQEISLFGDPIWSRLMLINLFLAAFNLLPAFPMDGGRVLCALLAKRLGRRRGTAIAANIGQGIALLLGFIGLFYNPILLLIAIFIYYGAQAEAAIVETEFALKGMRVSDAMMTRYRTLSANDCLDVAVGELLASDQKDFPVVENGQVMGILRRKDLIKVLGKRPITTQVSKILPVDYLAVDGTDSLLDAVEKMRQRSVESVPIVMGGNLIIGMLTTDHINEVIRVKSVLERRNGKMSNDYQQASSTQTIDLSTSF